MLTAFRTFAKSKWAIGLLVLLGLGLVVTGGSQMDVLANLGPKHVVSAGDRSLGQAEFRGELDRILEQARQQSGRPLTFEELIGEGGLRQYLEQKSQQLGFVNWAWKAGIRPGKELVLRQIRQAPNFFDSVTGQFSEEQYRNALAENNVTPEMFEAQLRDQYSTQHYGAALGAGMRLPRVYGAILASQALETRDGRWFTVTQAMAGKAGTPTDAQLTALMNQNADQLRMPESRTASVVLFDDGAAPAAAPTEARIAERFNFRRDALSLPEKRSFVTLTAPNRAAADRIAAALRAGQSPAEVARANSIQPAEYNDTPRSALGDPAVAAAVFGLAANQVSAPVQAGVGFVVAKVTSIQPGRSATLADVREQVIAELRAEDARASVYRRVEAYEKARQEGKTLDVAVREVGARIIRIPPIRQDGKLRNGQDINPALPPQLIQSMWSLGKGAESEVVDMGQGQYFVVRLDDIMPAALPPLAGIREPLAQQWVLRENARLLSARASALAARVRGGEDLAAVAASVGATLQTGTGLNRQSAEQNGQGVIAGVFGSGRGEPFSQQNTADTFVIGRTDRITAAVPALAAPMAEQFRQRMAGDHANAVGEAAIAAAAARSKAEFDEPLARTSLGLPAEAPAAAATPGAPPAQ
ncbi:MAG: peptidylprolyl isomerase [Brevundimonas sp.]|uniref:peptidylprolyl isomerase n=1 Tax=Brevundimonas sp. TaxID=1871086 RepID=UPI002726481F|nr:peptidylprolyl isomerase [Brevundimonas sp.]MDO9077331.1 peptidylprolyl isomerase [Brevundimonas sp.]MDP3081768.1 peptidylprolyl isomerase [Brevundimonas sp.]MDZ4062569.1 peptidylprolyl isomerase [Brevundimonas sp.]